MEERLKMNAAIGRAKTVLVFGNGAGAQAVITALVAQWVEQRREARIQFSGPVRFAHATEVHIETVVLPLVDAICKSLGLGVGGYDLSGVNLGAASSQDIGIDIDGFSADVPLFLAMLSARLRVTIPQGVVCTGHIASVEGEVRAVRNLPLKLAAARSDSSIQQFFYPALDADASLATLAAAELNRIQAALAEKGRVLKTVSVRGVDELLTALLSEEAVIAAALNSGHLKPRQSEQTSSSPVNRATRFLGGDITERFYEELKNKMTVGDAPAASRLLACWATNWIRRKRYPQGFGGQLRRIVQSVPPSLRIQKLNRPLLSIGLCIALSQCASNRDFDDVLELYRCVSRAANESPPVKSSQPKHSSAKAGRPNSTLEIVRAEIDKEYLTATICLPVDAARASFVMDTVTADSPSHALEVITTFYIHLMQYTNRTAAPYSFEEAGPKARVLLEKTFARNGGVKWAMSEAISGIHGGLRFVLDQMTEQFKRDSLEEKTMFVCLTAIESLPWIERVAFIKELFARCPDAVPAEFISEPERFVHSAELIVRTYVSAMDDVKQMLRTM